MAHSMIRLPNDTRSYADDSGAMATLASVPWFLLGLGAIAWERVSATWEDSTSRFRSQSGYRNVPVDEDAQVLRFADEE